MLLQLKVKPENILLKTENFESSDDGVRVSYTTHAKIGDTAFICKFYGI